MSKEETQLAKAELPKTAAPAFVDAEKLIEKFADITRETAARAYDFFVERGAQLGTHLEDWLRAEAEMLRVAPVKITETKDMVNVMIAVPGFKADEIEVSVDNDMLIVSGETKDETKEEGENTFYSEWRSDRFLRKLALPAAVDIENVDAKLKDGVLKLGLKKAAEHEVAKVKVQAA